MRGHVTEFHHGTRRNRRRIRLAFAGRDGRMVLRPIFGGKVAKSVSHNLSPDPRSAA